MPSRLPVDLGSVRDPDAQVGRLHRLAVAGGPSWVLARLLRRGGWRELFLAALLGRSSAVQLLLAFGANPNHRCLDGSTPVHAGAFSGRSLLVLLLLQAGGDLRLHDQQGRTPQDWAEQSGAKQSWEVLELLQLCRTRLAALVHGRMSVLTAALHRPQTSSGHSLCGSLSSRRPVQADRALRPGQIGRSPQPPALGFGQLSSLQPIALAMGIPLVDPQELLPAQGEPDCTYESSSCTLMANLLWRGHPVTVRQLKTPGAHPDVLLADLQHCSALHHPSLLLLLLALSPSVDLSGLCLLFEPVLGSLHVLLHSHRPSEEGSQTVPGLPPGRLLLQVLEALLFLQARCWAHGGLSSHAVQLVRPGLVKVGSLEHGRLLRPPWLQLRPRQACPGPGLPPPPQLYPWLPLELICGDEPTATSDLYSFCILAQEVFTGELPWAGKAGSEVKAKLEAVFFPQDPTPEVSSLVEWTTLSLGPPSSLPENLCCEAAPSAKIRARLVPPGAVPSKALKKPEVTGHHHVQRGTAWDLGSSLILGSSPSPSPSPGPSHIPTDRVSLHCCLETSATAPSTELMRGGLVSSLQKMDLLEEIMAELQNGCHLGDKPSLSPTPGPDS